LKSTTTTIIISHGTYLHSRAFQPWWARIYRYVSKKIHDIHHHLKQQNTHMYFQHHKSIWQCKLKKSFEKNDKQENTALKLEISEDRVGHIIKLLGF
jgi:hypothetical protein